MKIRGAIRNSTPLVGASIRAGTLRLGGPAETHFVVDTGFTGSIAIPKEVARRLRLTFVGIQSLTLATGVEVEVPLYVGNVRVGTRVVETSFIVGDALIGMELLEEIASGVRFDLEGRNLSIELKPA